MRATRLHFRGNQRDERCLFMLQPTRWSLRWLCWQSPSSICFSICSSHFLIISHCRVMVDNCWAWRANRWWQSQFTEPDRHVERHYRNDRYVYHPRGWSNRQPSASYMKCQIAQICLLWQKRSVFKSQCCWGHGSETTTNTRRPPVSLTWFPLPLYPVSCQQLSMKGQ